MAGYFHSTGIYGPSTMDFWEEKRSKSMSTKFQHVDRSKVTGMGWGGGTQEGFPEEAVWNLRPRKMNSTLIQSTSFAVRQAKPLLSTVIMGLCQTLST